MRNVKFDHALTFYMLRKVFSHFFSKTILGLSKAIEIFESPYLVMGNLSVPSISLEVLDLSDYLNLTLCMCGEEGFANLKPLLFGVIQKVTIYAKFYVLSCNTIPYILIKNYVNCSM